jgi:hypothetical protein
MNKKPAATLKESDSLTIAELADIFGFPVSALVAAIERNRRTIKKPFYNVSELAKRWDCSRATVYNILRECEFKMLNVASKENKERNSWRVPTSVVERIEQSRMEPLPEAVQTAA